MEQIMGRVLKLPHGRLSLPAFLPDGTRGVVRAVDSQDLLACGVQAVQMNVFHLMQRPGTTVIQALGGLHRMTGWTRPIFTDSGGYQIYSLIHQNPKMGTITERGAIFHGEGAERKYNLTPEKSIQLQMSYGADVLICLDDCTHVDAPAAEQESSVRRTVKWARQCKVTFERLVGEGTRMTRIGRMDADKEEGGSTTATGDDSRLRPLLIAVIQGGNSPTLRRQCAEALLEIGFDGFGYGGWPLDGQGNLLAEMLACTRELVPEPFPLHALGVGHPANVLACSRMGYQLFDSTMPTRDARHGRLYALTVDPAAAPLSGDWFTYCYVQDDKHLKANLPISPYCDCPVCHRYSLGYLHHLYKLGDSLYSRLATMHNLRFMTQLMTSLSRGLGD
ncbi:MAG: tRNA guanosine(34) transglycosylase Tgt [Chloroflexota bacterium]